MHWCNNLYSIYLGLFRMSKSILDPEFKYVPSASTNIAKTFAKIRKDMQAKTKQVQAVQEKQPLNIMQYKKFKG
jgi:hypothetical protein